MMPEYDVVIPCAPKDYVKIRYCVDSLINLKPLPSNIYIVSRDRLKIPGTIWVNELSAIPISVSKIKYRRPNWIYQQILKMTQDFTENDNYLCIDSDLIINKTLEIINCPDGTVCLPNYFISNHKQNHAPYFTFMERVWNLKKVVDYSFISDITFFRKNILRELIPDSNWILDKCNQYLSEDCLIGEPEIYGNYLAAKYPESFNTMDINVAMYGKFMPDLYTTREIDEIINKEKNSNADIIAIHSWT